MPEWWVFDVDGSVVDLLTGGSLRPGTHELLTHLKREHNTVIWWSAGGDDYAARRAEQLGVAHLVDAFHAKDERDHTGRYVADHVAEDGVAVVFVDDRAEDLPLDAVVVAVAPYLTHNPHDRGLAPAARRAGLDD